ncbi:MAG TPA: dihydropteroate synthase-like protein, partial [Methanoregula sp.]|nr:dihydropteroate synthase-like protein [Methanoregula sp.]
FEQVERETGIPVFRGPRHAADLALILPLLDSITLSRTIPADDFLSREKAKDAYKKIRERERMAGFDFLIRNTKIGGGSRIKVLAEVMDAHKCENIRNVVEHFIRSGADVVDLGFGFDATPDDVSRVFSELDDIDHPLAVDSQNPDLIRPALARADIVLSLQETNIPKAGAWVADAGAAAIVVPGNSTLKNNLAMAKHAGIECLIADPLLQPVGSGLVASLKGFRDLGYPLFFGAGNVTELIDADSVGVNALLAGMAYETSCSLIFTSAHSDKTCGSIWEMRRATEMMSLCTDRPYPKDLGIDLLVLKEKRRRREPPIDYDTVTPAKKMPGEIEYDPKGNFRIGLEGDEIVAVIHGRAVRGRHWEDVLYTILSHNDVTLLDHAAYLGKELYKAEMAVRYGRSFEQDGEF